MKKYILGILLFIVALFMPSISASSDIMSLDETEGMPITVEDTAETWTRVLDTDVLEYGSKISLRDEESLFGFFGEYIKLSNAILNEYGSIKELMNGEQEVTISESIGQVRFEVVLQIDNFFNCSNSCYIGSGEQNDTCRIKMVRVLISDILVGYAYFTSGGCHNNCDDAIDAHTFTDPGYFFDTYNVINENENYDTSISSWASYMFENMFYFSSKDKIEGIYDFEEVGSISLESLKLTYPFIIASGANGAEVSVDTYDYYYDQVEGYFYAGFMPSLSQTDYYRTITFYNKIFDYQCELRFEVSINDNNDCTYLVEIYDESSTEILLHISYTSARVMTFEKVTSEYMFNESVILSDLGTWKKAEYNDEGYFVGSTNVTTDEDTVLAFYGYELVDYGDIFAPVVEATTINLNVDELLSVEEILEMVNVLDDSDATPELVVEASTYNQAKEIGTFYINVYAVDDYDNKSVTATITINVTDTTAPTLSALAKSVKNTEVLSKEDLLALFTATDNYYSSEELVFEIVSDNYTENATKIGSYAVSGSCTDPSGNRSMATTYINVIADITEDTPGEDNPSTPDTPSTPDVEENNYSFWNILTGEFWSNYVEDLKAFNFAWIHWTTLGLAVILVLSIVVTIKKKK